MDREKAADLLDNLIGMVEDSNEADYDTALRMGIEALRASGDIIYRQAVIDALGDEPEVWTGKDEYAQGLNNQWHYDRNAIKAVPSARPEQQWIPCSERLPKTHETGNSFSGIYMQSSPVLVYGVPEYEEEYGFHVVTYCDDKNGCTYWSTELDAVTINEVYAWMPLPEPWKGEQE